MNINLDDYFNTKQALDYLETYHEKLMDLCEVHNIKPFKHDTVRTWLFKKEDIYTLKGKIRHSAQKKIWDAKKKAPIDQESAIYKRFESMLSKYPELLTADHVVEIGLYKTVSALHNARYSENGLKAIRCGKSYKYPKFEVISLLVHNWEGDDA